MVGSPPELQLPRRPTCRPIFRGRLALRADLRREVLGRPIRRIVRPPLVLVGIITREIRRMGELLLRNAEADIRLGAAPETQVWIATFESSVVVTTTP